MGSTLLSEARFRHLATRMDANCKARVGATGEDRAALEGLLVRNLPRLEEYVRVRMGPTLRARETSTDLVQSVCREVLRDLSKFEYRGEMAFRNWLYARARRKLLHKRRDLGAARRDIDREEPLEATLRASPTESTGSDWSPSAEAGAREEVARIERAFNGLPDDYRTAITMHRMIGLPYAEIAARMQRSEGAVRNLVYRGLSRLALELAPPPPRVDDEAHGSS